MKAGFLTVSLLTAAAFAAVLMGFAVARSGGAAGQTGTSILASASPSGRSHRPVYPSNTPSDPAARAHLAATHSPSSMPPPTACSGSWASAEGVTRKSIENLYVPIRNCALVGTTWVLTTYHGPNLMGVIGIFPCAATDHECLSSQVDHPFLGWHFTAPSPGGFQLLGEDIEAHSILVAGGPYGESWFNLDSQTFVAPKISTP